MRKAFRYDTLLLVGGYVWLLLHHLLGFAGHNGFDDMLYAELAHGWLAGNFVPESHFSYRWGLLAPTTVSYALFGVRDFSSILPALIATGLTLTMVWRQIRNVGRWGLTIGVALFVFERWTLAYSQVLMADAIVALSVMLALHAYAQYLYHDPQPKTFRQALIFSGALMLGLLTKGSIILVLPLVVFLLAYGLIVRREYRFWLTTIGIGVLLMAIYLGILTGLTGNPMSRLSAIFANSYQNACSYHLQPKSVLIDRITYAWWLDLLRQGTLLAPLLALAGWPKGQARRHSPAAFWWLGTLGLLLCGNFMTVSLDHYQPLCLDVRHYLFIVPVAAVTVGWAWKDEPPGGRVFWRMAILVLVAGVIAFSQGYPSAEWLYFPVGAVLALGAALRSYKPYTRNLSEIGGARLLLLGFVISLALWPVQGIREAQEYDFAGRRDAFLEFAEKKQGDVPIFTDRIWMNLGPYYQRFEPGTRELYHDFTEADSRNLLDKPFYLLLDGHTQYQAGVAYEDWPYWAQRLPDGTDTLHFEEGGLQVFYLPGLQELTIAETFAWDKADFSEEFALTLSLDLPEAIADAPTQPWVIQLEAEVWHEADVPLTLVATVEDSAENTLKWHGKPFQQQMKALTTWWPVRVDLPLESAALGSGSVLKVYLWNPEQRRHQVRKGKLSIGHH